MAHEFEKETNDGEVQNCSADANVRLHPYLQAVEWLETFGLDLSLLLQCGGHNVSECM